MMSYLKKRSSAILIAVAVVILGTLFGVHRSVNRETAKIEALFYNGVYLKDEKYTQPSIASLLDKRATASLGLLTVADSYPELSALAGSLREARGELLGARTISAKYMANEKLQKAYESLYPALSGIALKDNEKASSSAYASQLDGAQGVIKKSSYNASVDLYKNQTLGAFPVNILKNFAFVTYPEYFGSGR